MYILSIDQGTTGSTALLVNKDTYEVVGKKNYEFTQYFPKPGLVEHDLNEIWDSVKRSIKDLLAENSIAPDQIFSIGITNQRETTCAYNKEGTPLAKAIVWQDRRTSDYCLLNKDKYAPLQIKTGLPLDSYFSATKMSWLLENNKEVISSYKADDLLLSTIDTFLLYKLTNSKSFKTEASNASRTLLMNLETCQWDQELLDFFNINKTVLPSIEDSFSTFGKTSNLDFLPNGIPITCILGDQQAALFGQGGNREGDLKCTYGTGAFILLNTGQSITYSSHKLLTTVAFKHNGIATYALEGATYIAGAAVQWVRDNLRFINDSSEIENAALLSKKEDIEDLFFLPFFTGIGSPHWKSEAQGAILGLTRGTTRNDISRACLEGIALSVNDSIQALTADSETKVDSICVDGGASMNNFLLQLQSNFSDKKIIRPVVIETTAYGVALGSLVGCDLISLDEIKNLWKEDQSFTPKNEPYFSTKLEKWKKLIEKIY